MRVPGRAAERGRGGCVRPKVPALLPWLHTCASFVGLLRAALACLDGPLQHFLWLGARRVALFRV